MNEKQLRPIGWAMLALGGGMVGIVQIKPQIQEYLVTLPDWFYMLCVVVGFPLTVLSIVLLLLPVGYVMDCWKWLFGRPAYVPGEAQREDLERIHQFAQEEFGDVSPLSKMKEWYKLNRNIFHVLQCVRTGKLVRRETLVGYYSIVPLKKGAIPLLENDNFDGTMISNDLIVRAKWGQRLEKPACIYIGSIAVRGSKLAMGKLVGELMGRLKAEKDYGVTLFYSRPVTERGLEMLKENEFEPVNPHRTEPLGHIYKRDFSADA